jgi:hypothetical protein
MSSPDLHENIGVVVATTEVDILKCEDPYVWAR